MTTPLKLPKTVADYAAIAVAPLLIFVMICALANFLMLLLYSGPYGGRVSWLLVMYTMGAVSIARIAIEFSRNYSLAYAAALGAVTYLALMKFVGAPIFSLFILVVIAYLADVIVRDCTLIEDQDDASGEGLIDAGRLFVKQQTLGPPSDDSDDGDAGERPKAKRNVHQPGRSVMYLAAGALPLFGLGQMFLRSDPDVWSSARWLLALYLFAALSLLVTTSFLGLRRYLRQRSVEMPADVSIAWLAGGLVLIACVLMIAYLAPLPGAALASLEPPQWLTSPDNLQASSFGWGDEGVDETEEASDEGSPAKVQTDKQTNGEAEYKKGAPAGDAGQGNRQEGPAGGQESQNGQKSNDPSAGDKASPQGTDQTSESDSNRSSNQQGQSEQRSDQNQNQSQSESQANESKPADSSSTDSASNDDASADSRQDGTAQDNTAQDNTAQDDTKQNNAEQNAPEPNSPDPNSPDPNSSEQASANSSNSDRPSPPPPSSGEMLSGAISAFAWLIKAAIFLGLLAIVLGYLWLQREAILAWWQSLFQSEAPPPEEAAERTKRHEAIVSRPFASFENPIGRDANHRRAVVITFQAFEAWSREHGASRGKDETPAEFIRRIRQELPNAAPVASKLVDAYNRVVYGRGKVTRNDLTAAGKLWEVMEMG